MPWNSVNGPAQATEPYLAWSQATGFAGHAAAGLPGARVPVLLRLRPGDTIDRLEQDGLLSAPGLYRRAPTDFCVGHAPIGALGRLAEEVEAMEFGWPIAAGAVDGTLSTVPEERRRLVVGVVDRDFAFLNRVFRKSAAGVESGQTRILSLWDQSRRPSGPWQRPRDVGYGRELDRGAIDALVARVAAGESERALYAELDYTGSATGAAPDAWHGTFVADVAAGLVSSEPATADSAKPAFDDAATTAELILVSLPTLERGDTTGATPAPFWLDAVRFIVERAGPGAQVVINLSVGMFGGPHDGTSLISRALQELLALRSSNLVLVISAGNAQAQRWSASGTLPAAPDGSARLAWRLQPNDITDSFLELWMHSEDGEPVDVELCVSPPDGDTLAAGCLVGQAWELHRGDGRLVARVALRETGAGRAMALLSLAPVAGRRAAASPGRWQVELRNRDAKRVVHFHAWIQRDEPPLGFDQPLQSAFDEVVGARVPGDTTVSDLACEPGPLVVGAVGLRGRDERSYSSRCNPDAVRPRMRGIDLAAPADAGAADTGLMAAGARSGSRVRMSGTSVAAPIVARRVACQMWEQGLYDPAGIKAVLEASATERSRPSDVPIIRPRR